MRYPFHALFHTLHSNAKNVASENPYSRIDGWLGYDFRGKNPLMLHITGLSSDTFFTRRFFYWAPCDGTPIKIVHKIDEPLTRKLHGRTITYRSQHELESTLFSLLRGKKRVAMEYWPHALIPLLSIVDAGIKEFVEASGVTVIPSWELLGPWLGQVSDDQIKSHKQAAEILRKAFSQAWKYLQKQLEKGSRVLETALQKIVIDVITDEGGTFDHPPIVAANAHSAIPHFENSPETDIAIGNKSIVLIDAWCKMRSTPNAVYADLTDMAYTGKAPPEHVEKLYSAAHSARIQTISYIQEKYEKGDFLTGENVDLFTRSILKDKGVMGLCLHRTGHNIYTNVHGPSTNLDSFETVDVRRLYEKHLYSIEPGLYVEGAYGIRLECNVFLGSNKKVFVESAPGIMNDRIQTLCCDDKEM